MPNAKHDSRLANLITMALAEPIGLIIQTDDFVRLRSALYAQRQHQIASGNGDFLALGQLQFRQGPEAGMMLIVRRSRNDPPTAKRLRELTLAFGEAEKGP